MKNYARKASSREVTLWKNKKTLLYQLTIELTERCNNNCVHCYINRPHNDGEARSKELSTNRIMTILEDASILQCEQIIFSGGEPLLRKDFPQLYTHTIRLGMSLTVVTNGILIDDEIADLFRRVPLNGKLVISLYGTSQVSYESICRIPGSFEAALSGIRCLQKSKIPFEINFPILPQNKHEIDNVERWVQDHLFVENVKPRLMVLDLHSRRNKFRSESIKDNRLSPQEQLQLRTRNKEDLEKDALFYFTPRGKLAGPAPFVCGAGSEKGTVDAYGMLQMCSRLRHPETVYNLSEGTLKDAFEYFFPKLRSQIATAPDFLHRCGTCFLRGFCDSCAATSWSEFGDLYKISEYICEIAHLEAKHLGLVKEEENAWDIHNWKERLENFVTEGLRKNSYPKGEI